jgi:hypothetical protein
MITKREKFLMRAAMDAHSLDLDLDYWLRQRSGQLDITIGEDLDLKAPVEPGKRRPRTVQEWKNSKGGYVACDGTSLTVSDILRIETTANGYNILQEGNKDAAWVFKIGNKTYHYSYDSLCALAARATELERRQFAEYVVETTSTERVLKDRGYGVTCE